jgi:hypothetical protein
VIVEWDDQKAAANAKKHGVTFQEAATVLEHALSITFRDPDHSIEEFPLPHDRTGLDRAYPLCSLTPTARKPFG